MQRRVLTILFATRNGENVLSRTLNAYRRLDQSNLSWKLVIVDNGSSDSTLKIIRSFQEHLPIEVCYEPIPGKNKALNRGLHAVEGELVILTDDDTFPNPSFLQAWAKFLNTKSEYGLFGGSIFPFFDITPPSWLTADSNLCTMLFGARELQEGPVKAKEIFGGNMAVRRSIFENGFRFNETVGPNGTNLRYPMGGETEFCQRLAQAGISSWFAKEPLVHHLVRPHQITDSYLAERSYRCGLGDAARMNKEERKLYERTAPVFLIKQTVRRLKMLLPIPYQRRKAIHHYNWDRGFSDACHK